MRIGLIIALTAFAVLTQDLLSCAAASDPADADFYVATNGKDDNPGTEAQPLATLDGARDAVRNSKKSGQKKDITVLIRGGTYELAETVLFGPEDSGTKDCTITYAAYPGEHAIFSGGLTIKGWQTAQGGNWQAELPAVKAGTWFFQQLFVNGQRRTRARHPNAGFFRITQAGPDDHTSFQFHDGDLRPYENQQDAQIVFLHDWSVSRVGIADVDTMTSTVTLRDPIGAKGHRFFRITGFEPHPRYYVEHAPELLDCHGEWYLDREGGILSYLPYPGEEIGQVNIIAPALERLLTIQGDATENRQIRNLRFVGLEFAHCAAPVFPSGYAGVQSGFYQSRSSETEGPRRSRMPAAVVMEAAADCQFVNCRVSHVGGTAISLQGNCEDNRLVGNEIDDVGGNGLMVGESSTSVKLPAKNNLLANNHIHDCGLLFHGCVGIWLGITADTTVSHNEIHHLPYTGVSVGWMWNTSPTPCQRNIIEYNHIHHVMQVLSDGGGIYTLGRQPGTVLRGNVIHDVQLNAGRAESNGLFIDEGSSEMLIEQNTIYSIARSPIRFHKAVDNTVRNNVLVTSKETPPLRYNATDEQSMSYEANTTPDAATWLPPSLHESQAGLEPAYHHRLLASKQDAFYYNDLLGRGVNLGNALEAPREGAWGLTLKEEFFGQIKQAGFDSVRIPIRWSAHAQPSAPFKITEAFFQRVDWAINETLKRGLVAVINMHHYEEIFQQPEEHRERFLRLWEQISRRYQTQSDRLYFELLNEPHDNLTDELWNVYLRDALNVVRETNRDRIVIVGPGRWNNLSQLPLLKLPHDDRRLIVTFHYYSPFHFTHQGARWVKGSERWLGMRWQGTDEEQQAIRNDLNKAAQRAERENRPLYLGEFGAYGKAEMESRARWARQVRTEAERCGISWAYWELAAGFGVLDKTQNVWRHELLSALIPE